MRTFGEAVRNTLVKKTRREYEGNSKVCTNWLQKRKGAKVKLENMNNAAGDLAAKLCPDKADIRRTFWDTCSPAEGGETLDYL